MSDRVDFIAKFPEKLSSYLLSFLDAGSLLACAAVNRTWNERTNRLTPEVWFKACLKSGISVKQDKYQDAREWKEFISAMLPRLRVIKASNSYVIFSRSLREPVRAIYYYNKKIAIAYERIVAILDTSDEDYYVEYDCNFKPSLLKFDDNILVVASTYGHISSWSTTSKNHLRDYIVHGRMLLSFDFLTDYSLLVSSIFNEDSTSNICMWSMEREGGVHKIDIVEKHIFSVILAPNPDPFFIQEKESCFLFALSEDCVLLWIVQSASRLICALSSLSFTIPPSPKVHSGVRFSIPFGFLYDGHELFITAPSPRSSLRSIWAWNFRQDAASHLETYGKIRNLLGVGEKYLVYNTRCTDYDAICVVDKNSNEKIALVRTPRITCAVDICFGHTSWLDGSNGDNDVGVVYVTTMNDVLEMLLVKFDPRTE